MFVLVVKCERSCKLPFSLTNKVANIPLLKIHYDLWGPTYFIFSRNQILSDFYDDCTRFTWFYPLKNKSDFFEIFVKFQKLVENQFSMKIKVFQSDGASEFQSHKFIAHLENCVLHKQISCLGTQKQNGIVEESTYMQLRQGLLYSYIQIYQRAFGQKHS